LSESRDVISHVTVGLALWTFLWVAHCNYRYAFILRRQGGIWPQR